MIYEQWNSKLNKSGISRMRLSENRDKIFLVYSFGKYGDACIELPNYSIDPIMEKLYAREMDFKECRAHFKLCCKCRSEECECLSKKFIESFSIYEKTGNVEKIVHEINNYSPKYKNEMQNQFPQYSYVVLGLGDRYYNYEDSYLFKFLNSFNSAINIDYSNSLLGSYSGRINRWFSVITEYELGCGKVRIICNLGINTLDWIGAKICSRYDKFYGDHIDKHSFEQREDKIRKLIKDFNYRDLIDVLSKNITALQPVQVQCGGYSMYDHEDYYFLTKLGMVGK